ncbi:hypothetical protein BH09BAC6_BH09BAC6_14810 [soil metagenome]
MRKIYPLLLVISLLATGMAYSQHPLKYIPLPKAISGLNEEFSGMCIYKNRVYLEPQYGDHKGTRLSGGFNIYNILADSITRVIKGKDSILTQYKTIRVSNLNLLPDSVKQYYEGFEAISIVNNQVYLSIETTDTYGYCFLLKGVLDIANNQIMIDPVHILSLKRPLYIKNAGFESVTWLPSEKKLLAYYEYNGQPGGRTGMLIDTGFKKTPEVIKSPFLYFRITDIAATKPGRIYGINYFWSGDYNSYLNNKLIEHPENNISATIPDLRDSLTAHPAYLKDVRTTYARIVTLKNYRDTRWQEVVSFEGYKLNWEGLALFRKGALIVTDANRSSKQLTAFAYVEF